MTRTQWLLLFAVLLGVTASSAPAKPRTGDAAAHKQIAAAYARMDRAMTDPSVAGTRKLKKVLQDILAFGTLRAQMLNGLNQTIAAGGDRGLKKQIAHEILLEKLVIRRDKAFATVRQKADVIRADSAGEFGHKGAEHRIKGTMIYEDTWARIRGKWKLTSTKLVRQTVLVDGKPWKPYVP